VEVKKMAKPLQIELDQTARTQLERLRDTGDKAYVRERAAAILKIAEGMSASEVAKRGLHKPRQYQSVCEWVHRYEAEGIAGLYIRDGRGRKAAFSPTLLDRSRGSEKNTDGGEA
jgi:transposase